MRTTHAILRPTALAVLILFATLTLTACENNSPPALPQTNPTLTIAYDAELNSPLSALFEKWRTQSPDPIITTPDSSSAITLSAQRDYTPPDVLILSSQIPLPAGDRTPVSVRPWLDDPLVFVTRKEDPRLPEEILIDPEARIAIGIEAGPMGQYTRFGLRKIRRWDLVKSRVFRHSDAAQILSAVRTSEAEMGIVYATILAHDNDQLAARSVLEASDTARRSYIVVAQTPAGVPIAQWLTEPDQLQTAARFGLRPTPAKSE